MQQFSLYQYRADDKSKGSITGYYKVEMMDIGTACKLWRRLSES
jgi:hypothetical protein